MKTLIFNCLVIIALAALAACTSEESTPAVSETSAVEVTAPAANDRETTWVETPESSASWPTLTVDFPTATPLPTATSTPLPTPTITPTSIPIPNLVVRGAHINVSNWSPDSQWLAYWLSTDEDLKNVAPNNSPGGMLHLLDTQSEENCALPQFHTTAWGQMSATWSADSRLIVQDWDRNEQWYGQPCQPDSFVRLTEPPMPLAEQVEDRSRSPDGRLRTTLELQEEEEEHWRTMLTTLRQEGGEEITAVTWRTQATFAEDDPGGEWLSPTQFFIRLADGGPLLLDANRPGQAINVQTDLFGLAQPAEDRGVAAAPGPSPDSFYLLLLSNRFYTAPIQLYHASSGLIESLPYYLPAWLPFSPDYQWLILYERDGNDFWMRRLADVDGVWQLLGEEVSNNLLWNEEVTEIALSQFYQITWQTFPEGEIIGQWSTEPLDIRAVGWSPDGRFLVGVGSPNGGRYHQALFLFARDQR